MAPLALVDDIVESFRSCAGFAPYTFVAYAYSAAIATGAWERPGITLSLRFDPDGPSSWIRVHRSPRSRWHRQVVGHLVHTGYAIKHRFHDETVCQRWLRGKRELSAELRFLERSTGGARWRAGARWSCRSSATRTRTSGGSRPALPSSETKTARSPRPSGASSDGRYVRPATAECARGPDSPA